MGKIKTYNNETEEWEVAGDTAQTDQDIEITDSTKGVILNSATKQWRLTVDDTGTLLITEIIPL